MELNEEYWSERYRDNNFPWDAGEITKPLKEYFDQLGDKSIKIMIPGAGNAHEAEYLFNNGFSNVFVLDISLEPLRNIQKRLPQFPPERLIHADFFTHQVTYDLIIEQTFFCALPSSLRQSYASKAAGLLRPEGRLVGVLFDTIFSNGGPPFGGNKEEYLTYFQPYFEVVKFEDCYNSIKPRAGKELFINLRKR